MAENESETRDTNSDDATIDWPAAPKLRELPFALALSVTFAAAIVLLRPVVSNGSQALVACGVAGVVLLVIGIGSRRHVVSAR